MNRNQKRRTAHHLLERARELENAAKNAWALHGRKPNAFADKAAAEMELQARECRDLATLLQP